MNCLADLAESKLGQADVCLVGDAMADYLAAKKNHITFRVQLFSEDDIGGKVRFCFQGEQLSEILGIGVSTVGSKFFKGLLRVSI